MGRDGMVASCHPLASLAGVEVLRSGGNVVDAAIATNAVLGVTQPNFCGVGGDLFCLYYEAATRRVHFLNGAGRSGSRATLDELSRRGPGRVPTYGPASVSVPGRHARAGACCSSASARARSGTCSSPPSTTRADGFPTQRHRLPGHPRARARQSTIRSGGASSSPAASFPTVGQCFRQPDLARALSELGDEPELFYRGRVARAIADRLAADGFLTAEDLAAHEGEWGEPISTTYRGYTVYETPPPTQGLAALLSLNLLEGFDLARMPVHSVEHLHLLARDDQARLRRPRPLGGRPRRTRACRSTPAARQGLRGTRRRRSSTRRRRSRYQWGELDGDTTGFVVADGRGNVLSVIQSLYKSFGSGVVAPGTGVVLQNRGAYFNTDPAHPNCFAPAQAALPHPDRLRGHARRPARAGLLQHGRRRPGDVPHPGPHQRRSTTAWRSRRRSSGRASCTGRIDPGDVLADTAAHRGPRARRRARGASRARATTCSPCPTGSLRMGHAHGITLRRRHPARRRRSARRRRGDRVLMACGLARCSLASLALIAGRPAAARPRVGRHRARRDHRRPGARALRRAEQGDARQGRGL